MVVVSRYRLCNACNEKFVISDKVCSYIVVLYYDYR